MQTTVKKLAKSQVEIVGAIDAAELDKAIQKSIDHFKEHAALPGFRKGTAPEKMIVERAGEAAILNEAAELALEDAYPKILDEHKIDAIGRPEIQITKLAKGNPLEFKIVATVMPEVLLPDYKKIAARVAPSAEPKVEEKELNDALDYVRKSRAKKEKDAEGKETAILPELTDDFAKSIGKFENVEGLKSAIENNIKYEKEHKAREERREKILEAIAKETKMELPELIVHSELDQMIHEMRHNIEQSGLKWADYLGHLKKTEEDLHKEWHADAEKRAKLGLIMREIGASAKIEPPEDELVKTAKRIVEEYGATGEKLDIERVKERIYGSLQNEAILKFLEKGSAATTSPTNLKGAQG
jgi:FKBP-type peptidyl-prolyl cis-trans isomerase (trigger factor)